jgi:uncharacterized membrane protein YjjP (DUF1212 family)
MMKGLMNGKAAREVADPVLLSDPELEQIAVATLLIGRLLMETGDRAEVVHEDCSIVAHGFGADRVDLRSGCASIDITVGRGPSTITRTMEVGPHGVDHRLSQAIRDLVRRIRQDSLTPPEALADAARLKRDTPHFIPWLVGLAAGIACAAFGRLLGLDWPAFLPVAAAGAIGQAIRRVMLRRGVNVFVIAASVAFLSSSLAGLIASRVGSATVNVAMVASVLMLVPGVPALNAQSDIMEGHPTLGTARAVCVIMLLTFIAIGVLLAQVFLGVQP